MGARTRASIVGGVSGPPPQGGRYRRERRPTTSAYAAHRAKTKLAPNGTATTIIVIPRAAKATAVSMSNKPGTANSSDVISPRSRRVMAIR